MPDNFGERLKKLRKKSGLTQTQLAEAVGVSLLTCFRWEKNERAPRLEDIKALAKALNVSESDLLHDPPERAGEWILTIRHSEEKDEVLDLRGGVMPTISEVITNQTGAYVRLGGDWSLWFDDKAYAKYKKDMDKAREMVKQNGLAFGYVPKDKDRR